MASEATVSFNDAHPPHPNAIDAFHAVLPQIRAAIRDSRIQWDKHEPAMWSRAKGLSDHELTSIDLQKLPGGLMGTRSGNTTYGTIILGKLRIPAVNDEEGEGFIHLRIHDPPNRGTGDVVFHSIWTDEGNKDKDGHPTTWRAIQTRDTPLQFFNE